MTTQYLCIGHCCHDELPTGQLALGGSASYAALFAHGLGVQVHVITSFGKDFQFKAPFDKRGIDLTIHESKSTTCFKNIYQDGRRTQYLLARADTLTSSDLPAIMPSIPIVHICSIADEIDRSILASLGNSLVGASIQGFLRQWDMEGLVSPKEMDWTVLHQIDIVVLSTEDLSGHADYLDNILAHTSHVVVTDSGKGAKVYYKNTELYFPSYPVKEQDATGAGDVFTCAYLIAFQKTQDIAKACIYAHCAASFVVEGMGVDNMPSLDQITNRIADYRCLFN